MLKTFAIWAAMGAALAFVNGLLGAVLITIYATGQIDYCFVNYEGQKAQFPRAFVRLIHFLAGTQSD